MKIGIAGLGSAGTYLAMRLINAGFDVVSFDPKRPDYYIPCGYAVNENSMSGYMKNIGVDFSPYVLSRAESIIFTGLEMPEFVFGSSGLCTFDKNRLEDDLIKKIDHKKEKLNGDFDLAVDATGVSRSLLGPVKDDFLMHTTEYVTRSAEHGDFYFRYFPMGTGYFWEFPLGQDYHVGAGSSDLDSIKESLSRYDPMRVTARKIRLRPLFDHISKGKIAGVGESIGTVSPITGEGIVPSIRCAELLFRNISNFTEMDELKIRYAESVKHEFRHYEKLFDLLVNFRSGKKVSVGNITAIRSASKTMREFGIDFKISGILRHML